MVLAAAAAEKDEEDDSMALVASETVGPRVWKRWCPWVADAADGMANIGN